MELLKRLLFIVYVFWKRLTWRFSTTRSDASEQAAPETVFVWKDAWFLFWHLFFWGFGRWCSAHWKEVRPLEAWGELPPEAEEHYARFGELAARDSTHRRLDERILRPSQYRLSEEAARELCAFYGYLAKLAPWQYGLEARLLARRRSGRNAITALLAFVFLCLPVLPATPAFAFLTLLAFLLMLATFAGWCASLAIARIAKAATEPVAPTIDK